jgi:hypothetical protein
MFERTGAGNELAVCVIKAGISKTIRVGGVMWDGDAVGGKGKNNYKGLKVKLATWLFHAMRLHPFTCGLFARHALPESRREVAWNIA